MDIAEPAPVAGAGSDENAAQSDEVAHEGSATLSPTTLTATEENATQTENLTQAEDHTPKPTTPPAKPPRKKNNDFLDFFGDLFEFDTPPKRSVWVWARHLRSFRL